MPEFHKPYEPTPDEVIAVLRLKLRLAADYGLQYIRPDSQLRQRLSNFLVLQAERGVFYAGLHECVIDYLEYNRPLFQLIQVMLAACDGRAREV